MSYRKRTPDHSISRGGHAILFHVLPDVGPVYSVSIVPTGGGAGGYTMPLPEKDEMFNTKGQMLQGDHRFSRRTCGRGRDLRRYYDRSFTGYQTGDSDRKIDDHEVWYVKERLGLINYDN